MALSPTSSRGSSGAASAVALICDSTLGGTQATFDTNTILGGNIASTYNHLRIVLYARTNTAVTVDPVLLRFNNDSGSNYHYNGVVVTSAGAPAGDQNSPAAQIGLGSVTGASATANAFGSLVCDIANYANSANWKSLVSVASGMYSGIQREGSYGGVWVNTTAVTRITLLSAGSFVAGSRFSLYGIT